MVQTQRRLSVRRVHLVYRGGVQGTAEQYDESVDAAAYAEVVYF